MGPGGGATDESRIQCGSSRLRHWVIVDLLRYDNFVVFCLDYLFAKLGTTCGRETVGCHDQCERQHGGYIPSSEAVGPTLLWKE